MPALDPIALRDLALAAARAGGACALRHFRRPGLKVEWKADHSPVTCADREAEVAIREVVRRARPDDGWMGEETGEEPGRSGLRWIVDPVDGTRNFTRGLPFWSVLVACLEGDRPVASAVAFPALDEWYDAALGRGSRCNGSPIRVSTVPNLAEGCFAYYTMPWFERHGLLPVFLRLARQARMSRGGGDAWMHALVASGRAEVAVEPGLKPWDIAASSLLVTEAGGRYTDLDGAGGVFSPTAVLSNGLVHDEVLREIQTARLGIPG